MNALETAKIGFKHIQGANVPGGHRVIFNADKNTKPFLTPSKEFDSIQLRHDDVVVDIGAYVGTYAIRCARFPVCKVVAYEPTPATYNILSMTQLPNMESYQMAVTPDKRESVGLFISKGIGVTNGLVTGNRKAGRIIVPSISYTDAVRNATIVKIDVEGLEYAYPIVQPSIRALIIDFHPVKGNWQKRANEIISDIESHGFQCVIKPDWSNGWTCAGSWIREIKNLQTVYRPMIEGHECCGCGTAINTDTKGLCQACWDIWKPKHRQGYLVHHSKIQS